MSSQTYTSQGLPSSMTNMAPPYQTGYSMSFDGSSYPPPPAVTSFTRSFPTTSSAPIARSQIYTAVYSGVQVFEMDVGGVACMRRRQDGWLNATQILKIAGVDKGRRTKVLEKEVLTGEHEKIQGGYGKYQGTWIPPATGLRFCQSYGVEDILKPLLEYDMNSAGPDGLNSTPTKEQAMAASRRKMFVGGASNGPVSGNGTFFQNISATSSVALAAMNKAARINSPAPRANMHRPAVPRQSSQQDLPASQQSMMSQNSFAGDDSGYGTQPNGERPRKRVRRESSDVVMAEHVPMSPTEANESFAFDSMGQDVSQSSSEATVMPALPTPTSREDMEKLNLVLDLFAEQGKIDYSQHPALKQLSGEDFNIPLDASANNALHWAATLAKVPLLKLLIQRGANIWRGNVAGQTPLIAAVIVNNCSEQQCFPELLELLSPLIEVRDTQGRTVLHHIAVSSGIKGRATSSKYYLEALLEFLVRIGTRKSGDLTTGEEVKSQKGAAVSLVRFLSNVVNARDRAGNTALNLVARIGNRSIIQQLLEIHADPALPNNKGVSAKDFGVGVKTGDSQMAATGSSSQQTVQDMTQSDTNIDPILSGASQTEELGQDVITSMTTLLTQNLANHKDLMRQRTEQVDKMNAQIQESSAAQKAELELVQELQARVKLRDERQARIRNLKKAVEERRKMLGQAASSLSSIGSADALLMNTSIQAAVQKLAQDGMVDAPVSPSALQTISATFTKNNAALQRQADELHGRNAELEKLYRRIVSLCTGVPQEKVEEALPSLIAAIESEKSRALTGNDAGDITRVRDFLKRVEHTRAPSGTVEA